MKRKLYSFIIALVAIAGWNISSAAIIEPVSIERSDCKSDSGTRSYEEEPELSSLITYADGRLTLTVFDFLDQCCSQFNVKCNDEIPGELHFIISDESELPCDCLCYFDIECIYDGISAGHYKIFVDDPWGGTYLQTEADIETDCEIRFSSHSGIRAMNDNSHSILRYSRNGILKIAADGYALIEIYNSEGKKMVEIPAVGNTEISLNTLPAGPYIVKVASGSYKEVIKIIM